MSQFLFIKVTKGRWCCGNWKLESLAKTKSHFIYLYRDTEIQTNITSPLLGPANLSVICSGRPSAGAEPAVVAGRQSRSRTPPPGPPVSQSTSLSTLLAGSSTSSGTTQQLPVRLAGTGRWLTKVRSHQLSLSARDRSWLFAGVWADNKDFDSVLISGRMLQDHMPDNVLDALCQVRGRTLPFTSLPQCWIFVEF